jgi:hypothetical protein
MGTFNRPTDVAWGPDGTIYVADGYNNSRVVKISKDGVVAENFGTYGSCDGNMKIPTASPWAAAMSMSRTATTAASRSSTWI